MVLDVVEVVVDFFFVVVVVVVAFLLLAFAEPPVSTICKSTIPRMTAAAKRTIALPAENDEPVD